MKHNETSQFYESFVSIYFLMTRKEEHNMIPKDPVMLLSFLNLKLRDFYSNLDALCEDLDVDKEEIVKKLAAIDYQYDAEKNQFV